jgi:hypothetical protein
MIAGIWRALVFAAGAVNSLKSIQMLVLAVRETSQMFA